MKFHVEPAVNTKDLEEEPSLQIISIGQKDLIPENPWDSAHALVKTQPKIGFAEPLMDYKEDIGIPESHEKFIITQDKGDLGLLPVIFDEDWASPEPPSVWHLGADFSQLETACASVEHLNPDKVIRVAHFDTGYDPNHSVKPNIREDLQRNFVETDNADSAVDPNSNDGLIANPGHGTGTSGILAGGKGKIPTGATVKIGAAPFVEVVPVRISNSVVLIKTDAFAEAMEYIIELSKNPATRIHVVTMSMGGVASKAWAKVVNKAYEAGIFVVSAAGNNFGRTTPRTLIYPARFNRVIAACGITFDKRPYSKVWGSHFKEMQGNYGPQALMRTALAAFTPNMPWAKFDTLNEVTLQGAGTSSATPQIAAAAAIYWKKYHDELIQLPGWKQVETIRQAMFKSANSDVIRSIEGEELDTEKKEFYFGKGHLQAAKMLTHSPGSLSADLTKEDEDKVFLPFWRVIFGTKSILDAETPEEEMYQIEILQLIQISPKLQEILDYEERTMEDLNEEELLEFINEILSMKEASESLKAYLRRFLP